MSNSLLFNQSRLKLEHIFSQDYVELSIQKEYSFEEFLNNAPVTFQITRNKVRGNPDLERVCLIKKNSEYVRFFEHSKNWTFKDISNAGMMNIFGIDVMHEIMEKHYVMLIVEINPFPIVGT